jgi:hypothetical protein
VLLCTLFSREDSPEEASFKKKKKKRENPSGLELIGVITDITCAELSHRPWSQTWLTSTSGAAPGCRFLI